MVESNTIGNRIKQLRETRNETQADLAKALNVKRETVNQWENETRDLKTQYTVSLAEHFETTCDYILRGIQAENVSVHEKTGLSEESINKLKKEDYNVKFLYTYKGKQYLGTTNKDNGIQEIEKMGGENITIIFKNNFIKTVDVLIKKGSGIIYDLSKFLYADFTNYDREGEIDSGNYLRVQQKGQEAIEPIEASELNAVYLLKAQAKLLTLKDELLKERE